MRITIDVQKLPSGLYAGMMEGPDGPICIDGASVEGICRAACVSIIDALEDWADLAKLEPWK